MRRRDRWWAGFILLFAIAANAELPALNEGQLFDHYKQSQSFELIPNKLHSDLTRQIGRVVSVPLEHVVPIAYEFDSDSLAEKSSYDRLFGTYGAEYDKLSSLWLLNFDKGRSLIPDSRAVSGILCSDSIVAVNGLARILNSHHVEAERIPVKLVANWSNISTQNCLKRLQAPSISEENFARTIQTNYKFVPLDKNQRKELSQKIGAVQFLKINNTFSTQTSYAFSSIVESLRPGKLISDLSALPDPHSAQWTLNHAEGKSLLPKAKYAQGYLCKDGIATVDGHHKILLSLSVGATLAPFLLLEDWSNLSRAECLERLHEIGKALFKLPDGTAVNEPPDYGKMINDVNRYAIDLMLYKLEVKTQGTQWKITNQKGAAYPVLIKINKDDPMMEVHGAAVLTQGGLFYNPAWGQSLPADFLEQARRLLLQAHADSSSHPIVRRLKVVGKAQHVDDIDFETWVQLHMKRKKGPCHEWLDPS